jgi:serine/threonine protein kinase
LYIATGRGELMFDCVGPYDIEKVLGTGSYGAVYLVRMITFILFFFFIIFFFCLFYLFICCFNIYGIILQGINRETCESKALKAFFKGGEKEKKAKEIDIEIGMKKELDSPYIIRYILFILYF